MVVVSVLSGLQAALLVQSSICTPLPHCILHPLGTPILTFLRGGTQITCFGRNLDANTDMPMHDSSSSLLIAVVINDFALRAVDVPHQGNVDGSRNLGTPTAPCVLAPRIPCVGPNFADSRYHPTHGTSPPGLAVTHNDAFVCDVDVPDLAGTDLVVNRLRGTPTSPFHAKVSPLRIVGAFAFLLIPWLIIAKPAAFSNLDGSNEIGKPAYFLPGLLLSYLLFPPWEDALARAIAQISPLDGRAASLVRPERVHVAPRTTSASGKRERSRAAARIQMGPTATDEALVTGHSHLSNVAFSAPVPDAADTRGVAGRATFRAPDGTALGKAIWP